MGSIGATGFPADRKLLPKAAVPIISHMHENHIVP